MRIRHIAATATLAGLTTAGLISVTTTPATATATACINYLESVDQRSKVRDVICHGTEMTADSVGDEAALLKCTELMGGTFLPPQHVAEACQRAVQD
jgi:hypothetical protein